MHKTLHKKLTENHLTAYLPAPGNPNGDEIQTGTPAWFKTGLGHEMNMLKEAAKDLLQPRPEAVANLLRMAKEL